MKQALLILRKDVRYLRIEVCLLLALSVVFVWATTRLRQRGWADSLFEFAAAYTIARLIHAEAIPGERQFWLTRPYRPGSLALAKLLFIVLFIVLPMIGAQIAILQWEGFGVAASIPGLLCSLALLTVEAVVVAALASVTSSLVPFILVGLALAFAAFAAPSAGTYWLPEKMGSVPRSVEWMRILFFEIALSAIAICVLVWQYRDRATTFSRTFAIVALNLVGLAFLLMPGRVALTAQSWLSQNPGAAAKVHVASVRPLGAEPAGKGPDQQMRIPLRIAVAGVPIAMEVRGDALALTFAWPGETWKPARSTGLNRHEMGEAGTSFNAVVAMDPDLYRRHRAEPVTIRGEIYMSLFGDDEVRVISTAEGFTNVQDGLQCGKSEYLNNNEALLCRVFFKWPNRLVYARDGAQQTDFRNTLVSYSPLPSEDPVGSVEARWGDLIHNDQITIVTRKPLAHFNRGFELQGLRLSDLEMHPPGAPR